jgi:hypothetical protein
MLIIAQSGGFCKTWAIFPHHDQQHAAQKQARQSKSHKDYWQYKSSRHLFSMPESQNSGFLASKIGADWTYIANNLCVILIVWLVFGRRAAGRDEGILPKSCKIHQTEL